MIFFLDGRLVLVNKYFGDTPFNDWKNGREADIIISKQMIPPKIDIVAILLFTISAWIYLDKIGSIEFETRAPKNEPVSPAKKPIEPSSIVYEDCICWDVAPKLFNIAMDFLNFDNI